MIKIFKETIETSVRLLKQDKISEDGFANMNLFLKDRRLLSNETNFAFSLLNK